MQQCSMYTYSLHFPKMFLLLLGRGEFERPSFLHGLTLTCRFFNRFEEATSMHVKHLNRLFPLCNVYSRCSVLFVGFSQQTKPER